MRFASRYVRQSIANLVEQHLNDFGWTSQTPPFGADQFKVLRQTPKPADLEQQRSNRVFISFGDEPDTRPMQLGGGLLRVEHVVFVDVLAENEEIALLVADDITDRLRGLIGGTRWLRPRDHTSKPLPGYVGEFVDVDRRQVRPEIEFWCSVSATLELDFPGEQS